MLNETRAVLEQALQVALHKIRLNLPHFQEVFPNDHTTGDRYLPRIAEPEHNWATGQNVGWTTGFWTGMLWLAHQVTGERPFCTVAQQHTLSFQERLEQGINVDMHDLGFLYLPSCVTDFQVTGSSVAREVALRAADQLLTRLLPEAGILQAWGDKNDPLHAGRMIIDCLLNLPLLHWATLTSGNPQYQQVARSHTEQSARFLVREDHTTYHTYRFDPHTGKPLGGSTHQGAGDQSCWARGQAWGIYGFALAYSHLKEERHLQLALDLLDHFMRNLPEDGIAYWDLCFTTGSLEPRDSSANAVVVCALLELAEQMDDPHLKEQYQSAAIRMLLQLVEHCATRLHEPATGLLKYGVYSKPHGVGVSEANLWGDYYYLEALVRLLHGIRPASSLRLQN